MKNQVFTKLYVEYLKAQYVQYLKAQAFQSIHEWYL